MTTVSEHPGTAAVTNQPFYLHTSSTPVFATAHLPVAPMRSTAVLLCPPLAWSEQCSHRVRRDWADALAAQGYPALRFDFQGTGDSPDLPPGEDTVEAWVDAMNVAADWLRHETGCARVTALGLGFGGMLAWLSASRGSEIDDLVVWGTPTKGSRLIREIHASALVLVDPRVTPEAGGDQEQPQTKDSGLPPGDMLDDAGQPMRRETIESISAIDMAKLQLHRPSDRRVLLFERTGDDRLRELLRASGAELTVQPGEAYGQLMQYVQFSSLPEGVGEALLEWLEAGDRSDARVDRVAATGPAPSTSQTVELSHDGSRIRESIIAIEVEGLTLRGIMTSPLQDARAELCGFFLSGGSDRRIGHNRIWVNTARRWAALGTTSVRIDPPGLGDSEGDPADYESLRKQYFDSAIGRTIAMLDGLRALDVPQRFMVAGFCSGGWRAVRAALIDPRFAGVYAMDFPFFRWNWWIVHLRDSWIDTREPRPDESVARRIILATVKTSMRLARPLRRALIKSRLRSKRNLAALAQLRDQGTDLTFVYRLASDQLEEMIGDLTAVGGIETAEGVGARALVAPGYDPRYRPAPIQRYINESLDEAMLRARDRLSSSNKTIGEPNVLTHARE